MAQFNDCKSFKKDIIKTEILSPILGNQVVKTSAVTWVYIRKMAAKEHHNVLKNKKVFLELNKQQR